MLGFKKWLEGLLEPFPNNTDMANMPYIKNGAFPTGQVCGDAPKEEKERSKKINKWRKRNNYE